MKDTFTKRIDQLLKSKDCGALFRLALERALKDRREAKAKGWHFRENAANYVLQFIPLLPHVKGKWAGKPLILEEWQKFALGEMFGWYLDDGHRRYREAYWELCRKNAKTTTAAACGNFLLYADEEPGAEVFSVATKLDQAKISFGIAKQQIAKSCFASKVKPFRESLFMESTGSVYRPLGADSDTLDGLNPHGIIADEVHAWRGRGLYDVMITALGARENPMMMAITTAGLDGESLCRELHDYGERVLSGQAYGDRFFFLMCGIDPEDDPFDESVWVKANPNLNVSVALDYLREQAAKAKETPSFYNSFLRYHMGVWTQQFNRWIMLDAWDACGEAFNPDELEGEECFVGLDLSTTTDLTAVELVFPQNGEFKVLSQFFVPRDNIRKRSEIDRVPYDVWVRQGFIEATEGNVVDYDVVRRRLVELRDKYRILEVGYDPWNAVPLATKLQDEDGFTMVPIRQGFASLSAPTKELEKLIMGRRIHHNANPVLRWMAGNVAIKEDPAGNIKPDKAKSSDRIDGIVALIMAIDRASRAEVGGSVYESKELLIL